MNTVRSNAKNPLSIQNTLNNTIAIIWFHNTGDANNTTGTKGAFFIIPDYVHKNASASYDGQDGLYIGKNNLKWENKYLLRYSTTATTD